nr:MAG TPA: hypothetical protein [Caudoviricetes sp.]
MKLSKSLIPMHPKVVSRPRPCWSRSSAAFGWVDRMRVRVVR